MKTLRKPSPYIINLSALFLLAMPCKPAAAGKTLPASVSRMPGRNSIIINRQLVSRKHKIRLYPDVKQEAMFFYASGEKGKIYQLFLFDMSGSLIKQTSVLNKQTTLVHMDIKGTYLFEVFSNDERIESGEVHVK